MLKSIEGFGNSSLTSCTQQSWHLSLGLFNLLQISGHEEAVGSLSDDMLISQWESEDRMEKEAAILNLLWLLLIPVNFLPPWYYRLYRKCWGSNLMLLCLSVSQDFLTRSAVSHVSFQDFLFEPEKSSSTQGARFLPPKNIWNIDLSDHSSRVYCVIVLHNVNIRLQFFAQ